jgi:hypothetical protein
LSGILLKFLGAQMKKVILYAAILVVGACSGKNVSTNATADAMKTESWIDIPIEGCGVGSAKLQGMRDLARKAAETSGRADLARQMKTTIEGMLKRYQAQGLAEGEEFAEEQITNVTKDIVSQDLYGSRTRAVAERNGDIYALMCINPEVLAEAMSKMKGMNDTMRKALAERSKVEFDDLEANIERLQQ